MQNPAKLVRKSVSVWLAALMLSLSVAVPVLERADLVHAPVAESQHAPGSCPSAHDHTVCTQVGANLSATASGDAPGLTEILGTVSAPVMAPRVAQSPLPEGHPSRAPPLA